MNFNKAMVIAIAVLALGWGLAAEDQAVKVGIVDIDQAIGASGAGKAAREELDQKKRESELELQPMVERYQELAGEYQKKRVVLSDEKRREMEVDITELQNRIELKQSEAQTRLRMDFERLITPLQQQLDKAVAKVGRDGGYSLILVRGQPPILYSREALDITDLVIAQVEKGEE
ncbi:MAG TPA: OmpH family outer membrane protein [Myxococcales bacterium]|nr:OmpH family outer membrane protein [Myxococcales bacterium]